MVIVITDGDVLAIVRKGLNPGDLLMLGAILAWSIYTLVGRRIHDVPPITATAVQAAIAVALLTPFALINGVTWPSDVARLECCRVHRAVPVARGVRALERGDPAGCRPPPHPSTSTSWSCSRR